MSGAYCLHPKQVDWCGRMATRRRECGQRIGGRDRFDPLSAGLTPHGLDARGVGGELVVAFYVGLDESALTIEYDPSVPDVPPDIEVRTTAYASGRLTVYPREHDLSRRFVLVTGDLPYLTPRGWLYGTEAQQVGQWLDTGPRGGPGAWWVAQDDLRPIETLEPDW